PTSICLELPLKLANTTSSNPCLRPGTGRPRILPVCLLWGRVADASKNTYIAGASVVSKSHSEDPYVFTTKNGICLHRGDRGWLFTCTGDRARKIHCRCLDNVDSRQRPVRVSAPDLSAENRDRSQSHCARHRTGARHGPTRRR